MRQRFWTFVLWLALSPPTIWAFDHFLWDWAIQFLKTRGYDENDLLVYLSGIIVPLLIAGLIAFSIVGAYHLGRRHTPKPAQSEQKLPIEAINTEKKAPETTEPDDKDATQGKFKITHYRDGTSLVEGIFKMQGDRVFVKHPRFSSEPEVEVFREGAGTSYKPEIDRRPNGFWATSSTTGSWGDWSFTAIGKLIEEKKS
jgi:hypothetical protein